MPFLFSEYKTRKLLFYDILKRECHYIFNTVRVFRTFNTPPDGCFESRAKVSIAIA